MKQSSANWRLAAACSTLGAPPMPPTCRRDDLALRVSGPVGRAVAGYRMCRDTNVYALRFSGHARSRPLENGVWRVRRSLAEPEDAQAKLAFADKVIGNAGSRGEGTKGRRSKEDTRAFRGILRGVIAGAVLWVVMIYIAAVL